MNVIRVISVNVGRPAVLARWPNHDVMSSIDKRPVSTESVWLATVNLEGDEQADRRVTRSGQVHGGVDKAVYAYSADHFPAWSKELEREVPPGLFGENLTVAGITEKDAHIGDVWAWGDAVLRITQPRLPCYKLGYRIGKQRWRRTFRESRRTGWYMSVLREGRVPTSGTIAVVEEHPARVTVAEVVVAVDQREVADARILGLDVLPPGLRALLSRPERDHAGGIPEED